MFIAYTHRVQEYECVCVCGRGLFYIHTSGGWFPVTRAVFNVVLTPPY